MGPACACRELLPVLKIGRVPSLGQDFDNWYQVVR
ncbi:hypothetical protein OMCYN_00795 [cyanobiont of Ornithocercus magnificus]|nr:hypothetical protein OMCYN_00795 [cyanobiont of Ornithocercus magnificus]